MDIVTMTTASARLGVHYITLRRWCEQGKIVPMRDSTGRRLFYSKDVERLAAQRTLRKLEVRDE